ncbi:MAG: hypothetical protein H8E21_00045 [Gammaproteobacteria bacterium]|nr:hypothetical protein [Gammaproteobacteria bacterium]MBL6998713.1 hypothetical protein [Gammaproteobacteria bacterium]
MLSYQDCADYCDLSEDEVSGLLNGANLTPIEVCAMVQQYADSPQECRKMIKFLQDYMETVEAQSNEKRSHEIHQAINHFVANHRLI